MNLVNKMKFLIAPAQGIIKNKTASNISKILLVIALLFSICVAIVQNVMLKPTAISNIGDVLNIGDKKVLVATYDEDYTQISLIDTNGVIKSSIQLARNKNGEFISLIDMAVDEEQNIYLLKNYYDAYTGKLLSQELDVYDISRWLFKKIQTHALNNEVIYQWLSVSSTVILMGTDNNETVLTREAYDIGNVLNKGMFSAKSTRTYLLDSKEGIYDSAAVGSEVAYITKSGKVFTASDDGSTAKEVYPARILTEPMYPMFIFQESTDSVFIGEQESGDFLTLNLTNGSTEVVKSGTEPFSGVSSYAPINVLKMSMQDYQNYTAVVKNQTSGKYELLISQSGQISVVDSIQSGLVGLIVGFIFCVLKWLVISFLLLQAVRWLFYFIVGSRTILIKLAVSTIPMMVIVLVLFGFFSYNSYSESITTSFQKQVVDEGNMLTALFGTESFDEIEYAYDYTEEAYSYLSQQMNTRSVYTRTAYYESTQLYIGVDKDMPCFYPFDIIMNSNAAELYEKAAFTGEAQTGVINDKNGYRIVCVTPIGGVAGGTVYLLETGILYANMVKYTNAYLRSYVLISIIFIIAIGICITLVFMRFLAPIGEIKNGLEQFSKGDRAVRLENKSGDEFSDIIRVFNKMATDIDVQMYNLKKVSETYFRFIPQKVFRLLGKDNLGELELGSSVERDYHILCASLKLNTERLSQEQAQKLTNLFFNIINTVSEENEAILVTDSANLRKIKIICPNGGASAISIALLALSKIDGQNSALPVQNHMNVFFVDHKTKVYYGICGDEQRFVPTMLSNELDMITEQEELLRHFFSRLIVTSAAFEDIDSIRYSHRFIGYLNDMQEKRFGLYDFYDGTTIEETRLINETKSTFDKAMELYQHKRYYDAKNLFALVLRENQYDNVARYYIFNCEKNL